MTTKTQAKAPESKAVRAKKPIRVIEISHGPWRDEKGKEYSEGINRYTEWNDNLERIMNENHKFLMFCMEIYIDTNEQGFPVERYGSCIQTPGYLAKDFMENGLAGRGAAQAESFQRILDIKNASIASGLPRQSNDVDKRFDRAMELLEASGETIERLIEDKSAQDKKMDVLEKKLAALEGK